MADAIGRLAGREVFDSDANVRGGGAGDVLEQE